MLAGHYLEQVAALELEGEVPPPEFRFDGCTLAPDEWEGEDIRPACLLHDWGGEHATEEPEHALNDARFYRNLLRCARAGGISESRARTFAGVYYRRVRLWGFAKERALPLWFRVTILFSRYHLPRGLPPPTR